MCRNCYNEDQLIAADAYAEGREDRYIPTADEEAERRRAYLAEVHDRFSRAFYIHPNGTGLHVQCRGCGTSATGQWVDAFLHEHVCFE